MRRARPAGDAASRTGRCTPVTSSGGAMDKVILGRSGLKVSPICFGTWELGGEWGVYDDKRATAAIHRAREMGINFFDTAQGYGFGESEQVLGRALAEDLTTRRDEVVIATKGGLR